MPILKTTGKDFILEMLMKQPQPAIKHVMEKAIFFFFEKSILITCEVCDFSVDQ